jgi:high-affinity nickel-transport protein
MRHAFDPDHVVAMSTIVTRERSVPRAMFLGGAWGAGHCLSLFTVGLAVLIFRVPMSEAWGAAFERLVGVMLVVLGATSLWRSGTVARPLPSRRRPFAVGLVHGLAGSGALAIAVLATIPSRAEGLFYMGLFGIGAIGGMVLITGLFALPLRFATEARSGAGRWLPAAASVGSVAFGIYYLYQCR